MWRKRHAIAAVEQREQHGNGGLGRSPLTNDQPLGAFAELVPIVCRNETMSHKPVQCLFIVHDDGGLFI